METDRCILVCVTGQSSCERLIHAGAKLAEEKNVSLKVLSIFPPNGCFRPDLEAIGELDRCAKQQGAEMLLFYNDLPFAVAASVAKKYRADSIVTGFSENGFSGFITALNSVLPETEIIMVDKEEKLHKILSGVKAGI